MLSGMGHEQLYSVALLQESAAGAPAAQQQDDASRSLKNSNAKAEKHKAARQRK